MLRANKTMSRPISTTYYVHIKNIRLDKEGYSNVHRYLLTSEELAEETSVD